MTSLAGDFRLLLIVFNNIVVSCFVSLIAPDEAQFEITSGDNDY